MTTELTLCPGCDEPSNNGRTCRLCDSEDALHKALTQRPAAQEVHPLASRCYAMSEPHLSGYRLVLGFETLEAVDAAHTWVANVRKATQQATPEPVEEPVVWRWLNANGEVMTAWLPYKPDQRTYNEQKVGEVNGTVEYAYTRPAPGVPDWTECLRISEAPNVDEALRLFAEGETSEDQAVCIVRAVIEAYLRSKHGNV